MQRTEQLIDFLKTIEQFKTIQRRVRCTDNHKETDAEHAWHISMFILLFKNDLPEHLNIEKMLKFALIHDLPEIYAGDVCAFDQKAREGKKERDQLAARKLFAQLPDDLKEEFTNLYEEYEEKTSEEARIVQSFDKMQPMLQNLCIKGKSWQEDKLTQEKVDNNKRKHMKDPLPLAIYEQILHEGTNNGYFSK